MSSPVTHFAINTDDVDATSAFYGSVFGWQFQEYGPPGFVQVLGNDGSPVGAIQQRRRLLPDDVTRGYECTIGVTDVAATRERVVAAGCPILMEVFTITDVGHLFAFEDPGGNPVIAMQYDRKAR